MVFLILVNVLAHNAIAAQALLRRIKEWPKDLFDISAVIFAIQSELDRTSSSSSTSPTQRATPDTAILMECLAELCVLLQSQPSNHPPVLFYVKFSSYLLMCCLHRYTANRQPGKALPYFLRLRRPNVFELIREHNLFTAVQDQALLLVEFDQELMDKTRKEGLPVEDERGAAIMLLVEHTHSIPVRLHLSVTRVTLGTDRDRCYRLRG